MVGKLCKEQSVGEGGDVGCVMGVGEWVEEGDLLELWKLSE